MDAVPSRELAIQIMDLLKHVDGVQQLEELQAHRFGPHLVLNLTIGINGALTVTEGNTISSNLEDVLMKSIPNVSRVHVHYHPADEEHAHLSVDQIIAEAHKNIPPSGIEF
jgi:divalent metal cation (Fe/Co/Zn/Cd) transporter